jgi:hypothetical protein
VARETILRLRKDDAKLEVYRKKVEAAVSHESTIKDL